MSEVVVETRNLTKIYRDFWGRRKVHALKSLDLQIYRGEVFGLLGPNGSGKTTTIKLLLGLLFQSEGEALVFGKDASEVRRNERIGYLPEESYLYKFLNAEEILDFYGKLFKIPAAVRKQRVRDLIEMVGLTWARKRQLKEYSKGMTRRIGLAQALINDPELVVLDEPTSGLDPIGRVDSLLKVRDLTDIQTSLLSPEAVEEIRQVVTKHGGEVKWVGNPTTSLEELFLKIVEESRQHPGRRAHGGEQDGR